MNIGDKAVILKGTKHLTPDRTYYTLEKDLECTVLEIEGSEDVGYSCFVDCVEEMPFTHYGGGLSTTKTLVNVVFPVFVIRNV